MSSADTKVRHISTDTIRPATHIDSTQRFELTPWDLSLLGVNPVQMGLIFHQPKDDTCITHLKNSLSQTLDHFSLLAGRLATETHDDKTISVFTQCNNAGAEFVHATVDLTVSDILDPLYVPHIVRDFFTLNGTINYDGLYQPLLSIQVTQLVDGIFLGCTMNHTIADSSSFWHFMNSWSEISRSNYGQMISRLPILNRRFFTGTNSPIRIPASSFEKLTTTSYTLPLLEERVFHFAPQNIAKLETKANLDIKTSIYSFSIVLAHVWQAVIRAQNLDYDQEVSYRLLMGNRGKLDPPLPEDYFGNSVYWGIATTKVGELMNWDLKFAAELLSQVVDSHTSTNICNAWENWVKKPVILCIQELESKHPILTTGSSPRFNMYGNDFGWGRPIGVRSGCGNKFDGKITISPGTTKGSMDIEACLSPKVLKEMGEDVEFMQFVGVVN